MVRFGREREAGYVVPEGTFESALLIIKKVFGSETLGVSDTSFWSGIEEKATMDPKKACFQYYLAGIGHISLANILMNNFPGIYASRSLGTMPTEVFEERRNRLAGALLEKYPERYKNLIRKNKPKK